MNLPDKDMFITLFCLATSIVGRHVGSSLLGVPGAGWLLRVVKEPQITPKVRVPAISGYEPL